MTPARERLLRARVQWLTHVARALLKVDNITGIAKEQDDRLTALEKQQDDLEREVFDAMHEPDDEKARALIEKLMGPQK